MARRRLPSYKPFIPGFWPLVAALSLMGAGFGYLWLLAGMTRFEHRPKSAAAAVKAAAR